MQFHSFPTHRSLKTGLAGVRFAKMQFESTPVPTRNSRPGNGCLRSVQEPRAEGFGQVRDHRNIKKKNTKILNTNGYMHPDKYPLSRQQPGGPNYAWWVMRTKPTDSGT